MNAPTHTAGPRTRARAQRGIATIEFAICAPLLLLLMLATAELGRALFQYNTLVKAVRDGARYAATAATTDGTRTINLTDAIRLQTQNLVVTGNIAGSGGPLLPNLAAGSVNVTNTGNGFISVSVSYVYRPIIGARLPTFGLGPAINLSMTLPATAVMRV